VGLSKVWVYAETDGDKVKTITLEMLAKAREIGDTVEAVYGGDGAGIAETLGAHGATKVYATGDLGRFFPDGRIEVVEGDIVRLSVDAIVSTGAIIVDQDFFEALGFKHYKGDIFMNDDVLRRLAIDRIYDTYIDEDQLRICDATCGEIADSLEPRPYSSREFIREMGRYLTRNGKNRESVVLAAFEKEVPIFCPAFSDCSAGFGLIHHQYENPDKHLSIDSAKDFLELTKIKIASKQSGLFMIGGGVPKNFAQDTVVAGDYLGFDVGMHKYAVQITVADVRDGALSGSTLKEANSWGKVDQGAEQMVYAEATIALPLIAGYAYHKGSWKNRKARNYAKLLDEPATKTGPAEKRELAGAR